MYILDSIWAKTITQVGKEVGAGGVLLVLGAARLQYARVMVGRVVQGPTLQHSLVQPYHTLREQIYVKKEYKELKDNRLVDKYEVTSQYARIILGLFQPYHDLKKGLCKIKVGIRQNLCIFLVKSEFNLK